MIEPPPLTERALHQQVYEYLRQMLGDNAFVFHVPMGGSRHEIEAMNMKKLGTTAGIPDLEILHKGRAYFIELKSRKGVLSASQKYTIPKIEKAECPVGICRSLDEAIEFLQAHGIPLRTESKIIGAMRDSLVESAE